MSEERIILGIDPGTAITGYGLLKVVKNKAELLAMGAIELHKFPDPYLKLKRIYSSISGIIQEFLPDELAIEAPFYGKNVQSMLKLGRAQGVAMAAALNKDIPVTEYAPTKVKMSLTGNGQAAKEQVAAMLQQLLQYEYNLSYLDATDGLAVAYCHFLQTINPILRSKKETYSSWKDYVKKKSKTN